MTLVNQSARSGVFLVLVLVLIAVTIAGAELRLPINKTGNFT